MLTEPPSSPRQRTFTVASVERWPLGASRWTVQVPGSGSVIRSASTVCPDPASSNVDPSKVPSVGTRWWSGS